MEIEGAGGGVASRVLVEIRDYTALIGGNENAPSEEWMVDGNPPAITPFWQASGTPPVLVNDTDLGMKAYRLTAAGGSGGFLVNRCFVPLSRRYNVAPLFLRLGALGPRLRWRFSCVPWTQTPIAATRNVFGLLLGAQVLEDNVNNTGYEVSSTNGGPWEVRRRLVSGGAVTTFPIPSSPPDSLSPHKWEWVYTEGDPPELQLLLDDVVAMVFTGQANMPAINNTITNGSFQARWGHATPTAAGPVFRMIGGIYRIETVEV